MGEEAFMKAKLVWYDGGDTPSGWGLAGGWDGAKFAVVVLVSGDDNGVVHENVPHRAEGGGRTVRNEP